MKTVLQVFWGADSNFTIEIQIQNGFKIQIQDGNYKKFKYQYI